MPPSPSLVARLRAGPPLHAAFSAIPAPALPELLGLAGFDVVIFDAEHGPLGAEVLDRLVPAALAARIAPIIRVRVNEPSLIGAALDVGAAGVMVPQIDSAAAAASAVQAARFAPAGRRGANPYVRSAGYSGGREYFARASDDVALLLMVEGAAAVTALPDILATPGFDALFIGPFDLSQALGVPGEIEHPRVIEKVTEIVAQAGSRGVATAVFAPTAGAARRWLHLGVRLVALGFDTAMALQGFRSVRQALGDQE